MAGEGGVTNPVWCPTGTYNAVTKCAVCWPNCKKTVSVRDGRYYKMYRQVETSNKSYRKQQYYPPGWARKYNLSLIFREDKNPGIFIEMIFKVQTATNDITKSEKNHAIEKLVQAVNKYWNNSGYFIRFTSNECQTVRLPIKFIVKGAASGQHVTFTLFRKIRASAGSLELEAGVDDSVEVYAHEFGHCIGNPDEYGEWSNTFPANMAGEWVTYNKPDGSTENVQKIKRALKDRSMMSGRNGEAILKRHLYPIAIEVRDLIREKMQRMDIKCEIVK